MIAEFESRILALIDDMVDHASDDELFAGGYLRVPPDAGGGRAGRRGRAYCASGT